MIKYLITIIVLFATFFGVYEVVSNCDLKQGLMLIMLMLLIVGVSTLLLVDVYISRC